MKIVIAHNRYALPGGEDVVFEQETAMLRRFGHEVVTFERKNTESGGEGIVQKAVGAAQAVWSRRTYQEFSELLRRVSPDLVHVHNTFFRISPSLFTACADAGIPAVHTIHNYRFVCPATTLYRNGVPCEKCSSHNQWNGIARGCYRSSRVATALAASVMAYNWHAGTWTTAVSTYIAPSIFLASKLISAGLPQDRIVVKPHFVDLDPGFEDSSFEDSNKEYAIFLGRLSPEKGLKTLLSAWEQLPEIPVRIVGDGPQREELEVIARQKKLNITFDGHLPRQQAMAKLKQARVLVFPSTTYESFGMGIVEAYACGTPVIASDHGAMRELVEHGQTGLRFRPMDAEDLARSIRKLWFDESLLLRLSRNARHEFERKYTAEENYRALMQIYEATLNGRKLSTEVAVPTAA